MLGSTNKMKTKHFSPQHVHYMPKELEGGILYVSYEFGTAAHLCACGCGAKIRTPLGPTDWKVQETPKGPTLRPSVGNWQQECKSHYLITKGEVHWAGRWSDEKIVAGRQAEHSRHVAFYGEQKTRQSFKERSCNWFKKLFKATIGK